MAFRDYRFVEHILNNLSEEIHNNVGGEERIELRQDLLDCIHAGQMKSCWGYKRLNKFLNTVNYSLRKKKYIDDTWKSSMEFRGLL